MFLPSVVVQAAKVVKAQAELAVITRLVGLRANQSLEDVDGPLDGLEGLGVLMGFVLDRGDLATTRSQASPGTR